MSPNPISRARLIGSAAIVITTAGAIAAAALSIGPSGFFWAYVIGGIALGYALWSFVLHLRHPEAVDAAWDEQNAAAHSNSLIFGYWAALWVFVGMLAFVFAGQIKAEHAFFWLGPVLGAVPPAHYVLSVLRGRAE